MAIVSSAAFIPPDFLVTSWLDFSRRCPCRPDPALFDRSTQERSRMHRWSSHYTASSVGPAGGLHCSVRWFVQAVLAFTWAPLLAFMWPWISTYPLDLCGFDPYWPLLFIAAVAFAFPPLHSIFFYTEVHKIQLSVHIYSPYCVLRIFTSAASTSTFFFFGLSMSWQSTFVDWPLLLLFFVNQILFVTPPMLF
jgi:hypothetical protein